MNRRYFYPRGVIFAAFPFLSSVTLSPVASCIAPEGSLTLGVDLGSREKGGGIFSVQYS